jgi:hypothetical protein
VILLIFKIAKRGEGSGKKKNLLSLGDTALLLVTGFAGALTSLMSNVLLGILIMCMFVYFLIKRASFTTYVCGALAAIPEAVVLLLYLVVK